MTKEEVIDLISDAGFGILGTVEGIQPCVRPMMPYLTEDGELLIALLGQSRSIEQTKLNPLVEICFVDRKMWYARVKGKAKISENKDKKGILWENVPMLKQYFSGPEDRNFVLMEVEIEEIEASTPHQKAPEKIKLK